LQKACPEGAEKPLVNEFSANLTDNFNEVFNMANVWAEDNKMPSDDNFN
jgi:hypothetical protein